IESLDTSEVKISVDGRAHAVPRNKLFALLVAQPERSEPRPRCVVHFRDGSRLAGETLGLANDQGAIALAGGDKPCVSWSAVSRVVIRSSRVAWLSELKPLVEEQQAIVTLPMPARRDRSVSGGELKIGRRVFDNGLGVHARSRLVFAAEKKW